jgi:predicted secreted protein
MLLLTDSLSNLMAQEALYSKGNSKTTELKDLLAEAGSNLRLTWVPAHTGITGNERAGKAAKEVFDQNVEMRIIVVKSDYTKWIKEKCKERRQDEWRNSTNNMVTTKPQIQKHRGPTTTATSGGLETQNGIYTNITP